MRREKKEMLLNKQQLMLVAQCSDNTKLMIVWKNTNIPAPDETVFASRHDSREEAYGIYEREEQYLILHGEAYLGDPSLDIGNPRNWYNKIELYRDEDPSYLIKEYPI